MTQEETEMCARIRETGMRKLTERLDRLSKAAGVPWERGCLGLSIVAAVEGMCTAIYGWVQEVYREQCAGRNTFENHGIKVKCPPGAPMSIILGDDDDSTRWIKLGEHARGSDGRIAYPRMGWNWKNENTSTQVLDLLASDLRYVDDLVDFCVRYKAAKGELEGIKASESLERVEKARHQLELLERL